MCKLTRKGIPPAPSMFVLIVVFLLGGCMLGPDYRRPAVETPKTFRFEDREAKDLAKRLEKASLTIASKANEAGHLFGSVNAEAVAEGLKKDGYAVDAKCVLLAEPIRALGVYNVPVRIAPGLECAIKVWIVQEE